MCETHNRTLELLCNTCNKRICYGCAFHSHRGKDHVLTSAKEAEEKVTEALASLKQHMGTLDETLKSIERSVKTPVDPYTEANETFLTAQFRLWEELAKEQEHKIKEELDFQIHKERSETTKILENIKDLKGQLAAIDSRLHQPPDIKNKGHQLQRLKQWKDSIKSIKEKLEGEKMALQAHGHICTSFIPLSDNGRFVDFQSGTVVGAVSVTKHAAVVVRDERSFGGSVSLSCISSENGGLFWKNETDELGDSSYPIVISGSLYCSGGHAKILIACNQTLLAVSVADQGTICTIEEKEAKLIAMPHHTFITAISTITSGDRDTGVLLAVNASTELIRLNRKLDLFDKIDCSEFVHSISSLACVDSDMALIDSARNEVLLINDDNVKSCSCKLKAPSTFPKLCRPKVIQWDGTFWGLIWESTAHEQQGGPKWQHSIYLKNGKEYHSGNSDTCRPNTEVVSISFLKDQTLVCFSNGQVKPFSTNVI